MTQLVAIVPVKPLATAKGRLAAVLTPQQRRRLVLTMLDDVLGALALVPAVTQTLVVTADPVVAAASAACGAQVVMEAEATGLNPGVESGIIAARKLSARRVLVLPADLPFASAEAIGRLVAADASAELAMVPAADGDGTNALLISPPDTITPRFGPGSFLAHLAQALARRIDVRVLHLSGLALDIDRPDDVARLTALSRYDFLRQRRHLQAPGVHDK